MIGIATLAAPIVAARSGAASRTRTVEVCVGSLRALYSVEAALMAEISSSEAILRATQFGVDLDTASELIGFDLEQRLATARATLDRDTDELARFDPITVSSISVSIARMRASMDVAHDIDAVHRADQAAAATLRDAAQATLARLLKAASATSRDAVGVEAATDVMVDVFELYQSLLAEVDALFEIEVPGSDLDPNVARFHLAAARAEYRSTLAALERNPNDTLKQPIQELTTSDDVVALDDAVAAELSATPPVISSVDDLVAVFTPGISASEQFSDLVHLAADEATQLAGRRQNEAAASLRNAILVVSIVLVSWTAFALLFTRSINRRLRPLARRARELSEGHLDGAATDETGPPEIAVIARALNESATNLRRLQDQAAALASGDLDAPVLARPGVGEIGDSIHRSVQRLADSWREREDLKERLVHQANHDLLTSLPNRKRALEALDTAIASAARGEEIAAALFVDLDDFKRVNDLYGHHAGDRVLRLTAERLTRSIRHGDLVARLGGDEFVIVAHRVESVHDAAELARRIIAAIQEPFIIDGATTHVGACIGIGLSLGHGATAVELLRDADNAVHRAKRAGKGRFEVFDEHARAELMAEGALERSLRLALEAGELSLHYQPIVEARTAHVVGFEALARWTHAGEPVSPARFVAVAEQSDLVRDLGRWALGAATHQLATWTSQSCWEDADVAVNISGRHLLHSQFLDDVHEALGRSGLAPERLTIEVTETVVLSDLPSAARVLADLRRLGVRVSLDDFGTGYTSIAHLWQLPIDKIKIDGSFVERIDAEQERVLIELMIEVGHALGAEVVAECVETEMQLDVLRDLACDSIQGFLVARPAPAEDVARMADVVLRAASGRD